MSKTRCQVFVIGEENHFYSKMSKTASQIWEANLIRAYRVKKDEVVKRYPMQ